MTIDAHQHFWKYDPVRDSWITTDMQVIRRDFMPADVRPLMDRASVEGCVAVQADQSEAETRFLLDLAETHDWIRGVVGWIDLRGGVPEARLEHFRAYDRFKGVRHILQAEPSGFMAADAYVRGLEAVARLGLTYDLLIYEAQLAEAWELVKKLPEMRLVMDHIAKPDIKKHSFDAWAHYMKQFSEVETVYVKLSGMVTEADWANWSAEDLEPYIDFCLEHFGPKRLMYGSDWPVCLLAGSYARVTESLKWAVSRLSEDEQAWILGRTAMEFYELTP